MDKKDEKSTLRADTRALMRMLVDEATIVSNETHGGTGFKNSEDNVRGDGLRNALIVAMGPVLAARMLNETK